MRRKRKRRGTRTEIFVGTGNYIFWKAHGCNYLLSDYKQGIWNPLFPEVYENKTINDIEVIERIGTRYQKGNSVSQDAKPALIWALTTPNNLWKLVREIKRGVPVSDLRKPYRAKVWKSFDSIKETLRSRHV